MEKGDITEPRWGKTRSKSECQGPPTLNSAYVLLGRCNEDEDEAVSRSRSVWRGKIKIYNMYDTDTDTAFSSSCILQPSRRCFLVRDFLPYRPFTFRACREVLYIFDYLKWGNATVEDGDGGWKWNWNIARSDQWHRISPSDASCAHVWNYRYREQKRWAFPTKCQWLCLDCIQSITQR